jgi:tetratricopeptide (TPR) repeat protein
MRPAGALPNPFADITCADVDEKVRDARAEVARAGSGRLRRSAALAQLAALLNLAFQCRADRADLEESIQLLRDASALMPRQALERETVEGWLAMSLLLRRDPGDIDDALSLLRRSVAPEGPPSLARALVLAQLGVALLMRAGVGNGDWTADTGQAVKTLERALSVAAPPTSRPRRAVLGLLQLGLAGALAGRAHAAADVDPGDVERAARLLDEVDADVLDELVPGTRGMVERTRSTIAGIVSFNQGGRLGIADVSVPAGTPLSPASSFLHSFGSLITDTADRAEDLQTYLEKGSFDHASRQIEALRSELANPSPVEPAPELLLVQLAQALLMRARNLRMSGLVAEAQRDLDEALAVSARAALTDSRFAGGAALMVNGQCLLDRWTTAPDRPADLDDALQLLQRAALVEEPDSQAGLIRQVPIAEALAARAFRDGEIGDLDAAEDLLLGLRERLVAGLATRALIAVRLATVRMMRAGGTGETEDILRASADIRSAVEEVDAVSLLWAYDSAALWARWSRDVAPLPEQAEAHLRAVTMLYALARAQLTRNYSEVALRRLSAGLTAHATYALSRTGRAADAVVAAETGRAVLLALALETRRNPVPAAVDQRLRDRFAAAAERLNRAEAEVLGGDAVLIGGR